MIEELIVEPATRLERARREVVMRLATRGWALAIRDEDDDSGFLARVSGSETRYS